MDLGKINLKGVDWTYLAHNRGLDSVNTVMKLRFMYKTGNYLTNSTTSFLRTMLHLLNEIVS
jgi:hypothetical protein